ncbi:MAG: hypothetical protein AAB589_02890 [Patescibacteria group bacterium]
MLDFGQFKIRLETERERLEQELKEFAMLNPENPKDWQATMSAEKESDSRDETANRLEEWEDREASANALGDRLQEVKLALEKINSGTYGQCIKCPKPIEEDRLLANPAAATCKQHLE